MVCRLQLRWRRKEGKPLATKHFAMTTGRQTYWEVESWDARCSLFTWSRFSHDLKLQFGFDTFGQTIHIQARTDRGLCTHDEHNTGKNIHPETDGDKQDVGHGQTRLYHLHLQWFNEGFSQENLRSWPALAQKCIQCFQTDFATYTWTRQA